MYPDLVVDILVLEMETGAGWDEIYFSAWSFSKLRKVKMAVNEAMALSRT